MANFEHNVMVALYWGGEIITEMNGFSQPHFAEPIIPPSFQQLSMRDHRPFGEGSSSQRHFDSSHMEYEARENETDIDLHNDVNTEISDESSEEDEPSKDDDESEPNEDIVDIRDFSQNDIGINHSNRCEQDVPEMQNHDVPYFRTLENEEDIFMSTCESEMEHCSVWSEDTQKDLKKGMCFSSKEKLKRAVAIWSLKKNKEFKVVTSNKSLWVVRCKFYTLLSCLWFLRGRKVGDNLWKIGKYIENHRCETEGLSRGHANLNTNLIASLILNQIKHNPKVLVVDVISKVHEKFGHQVTYRKVWLGRQRAFELVYGDFEKSFSDLPNFFAAFQHFNHGTIVEWKHEESMSSLEELRRFQEPRVFHRFCIRHLKNKMSYGPGGLR
ncbi:hypothetical protein KY290_017690 [Solanum tuberosum]|uniref:Transposase MuDR plant domain-containing protein n=1 Tax=Solanum tuberosum TaxID=4113 RepID=A0ABQ7VE66_SOLTU|nr:hypothetical protein KY285_016677 [Solanum tuberosum]KAH0761617.1 hypothetical protein KY290_017690 [Solanum tuberosum]